MTAAYEPVRAADVQPGDMLLCNAIEIEVVGLPRPGSYWFAGRRGDGVAISWKSGRLSGTMIRLPDDMLQRLPRAGPAGVQSGFERARHDWAMAGGPEPDWEDWAVRLSAVLAGLIGAAGPRPGSEAGGIPGHAPAPDGPSEVNRRLTSGQPAVDPGSSGTGQS